MENRKRKSIYDIEYIIIGKESSFVWAYPPPELKVEFLQTIALLPKNLLQLNDPWRFQAYQWQTSNFSGYDISFIYSHNFTGVVQFSGKQQIKVIFISEDVSQRELIVQKLKAEDCILYIHSNLDDDIFFSTASSLIDKIRNARQRLLNHFNTFYGQENLEFQEKLPDGLKNINQQTYFTPSLNNTLILNQLIGNLWFSEELKNSEDGDHLDKYFISYATRKDRMKLFLKQLDRIDQFKALFHQKTENSTLVTIADPYFDAMILVCPYHYPKVSSIFPNIEKKEGFKFLKDLFKVEQDTNYITQFPVKDTENYEERKKIARSVAPAIMQRLHFLDRIAYFHASFKSSPIIRLPLKGPSLNKFIAVFNPAKSVPRKHQILKSIKKFGREYVNELIIPEMQNTIVERDRQIVAISDLPIEWLCFNEIPFSVTHDLTRLTELPHGGLMNSFYKHQIIDFEIDFNILSETLIVFGAPTDEGRNTEFERCYRSLEEMSISFGFKTIRCKSINDLSIEISRIKPKLLIFDTHGRANEKEKTTELLIGKEWMTGKDIIEHKISAPLVILSACETSPNWGYLNPITNAFLQVGCLSITATYLPISIENALQLNQRIVINLDQAAQKGTMSNWLAFIAYVIRTHFIAETIQVYLKKVYSKIIDPNQVRLIENKTTEMSAELMQSTLDFSKRVEIFTDFIRHFNNICENVKINYSQVPFEQLYYTTLGRGDLLYFKSWRLRQDERIRKFSKKEL